MKYTLAGALAAVFVASVANAQVVTHAVIANEQAAAAFYWTPERLAGAKPMEMHPSTHFQAVPLERNQASPRSLMNNGNVGSDVAPGSTHLFNPPLHDSGVQPDSWFSFGFFTESRVRPVPTQYPFRTVGQLFFHDPRTGGNFVCSASTISHRGIATAGHCVFHAGDGAAHSYWYTNWLFVPSTDSGTAPYGVWGWNFVVTTSDWVNGGGGVPNAHDFAIIQAADHGTLRIGDWVGWLGWWTGQISANHLTIMGYPCNLDSCRVMQRNDAQTFAGGGNNTWIYGSSMRGGASGGPWVRDFGTAPVGNPVTSGGNWTTAVTSYGPVSTAVGYLGASQFDGVWVNVWKVFCSHRVGNC